MTGGGGPSTPVLAAAQVCRKRVEDAPSQARGYGILEKNLDRTEIVSGNIEIVQGGKC